MNNKSNNNKSMIWMILDGILLVIIVGLGVLLLSASKNLEKIEEQAKNLKVSVDSMNRQMVNMNVDNSEGNITETTTESGETETPETSPEKEQDPDKAESAQVSGAVNHNMEELTEYVRPLLTEYEAAGATWSYYVEDIVSGDHTEYKNKQMQASNLIELYIMGAIYENYDKLGGSALDANLTAMITEDSDAAADELVKVLGGQDVNAGIAAVNKYCKDNGYINTTMGRLLQGDKSTGDNFTSVVDCGTFLKNVYNGDVDRAEDMVNLLKNQKVKTKIPSQLPQMVETANKCGTLEGVESDVAIVYGEKNTYILCVMTEDVSDAEVAKTNMATLSYGIYGFFSYEVQQ